MHDDLVSVIIPCFRQGHFLSGCVDSVLAQSHPNVQPIVVNDGSDDDTDALARRYGERITYVYKPNGGLPSARNAGIRRAEGKYLYFLDADDLIHPDALAQLIAVMDGRVNRVAVMGFRFFEDGQRLEDGVSRTSECVTPFLRTLIQVNFAPPHSYLSSRQAVLSVGGFEESLRFWGCEDWDLWARLALAGNESVSTPFVGAYYRRHANSMSTNQRRMLESRTEVLLRMHQAICQNPELLSQLGSELLITEQRVRRRCLAQGLARSYVHALTAALRELETRGFTLPRSRIKRAFDRLAGTQSERLALLSFFYFEPERYYHYANGVY